MMTTHVVYVCTHAGESIEFISDTNTVTGEVVYKAPDKGIDLLVFTNNNLFLPNMSQILPLMYGVAAMYLRMIIWHFYVVWH